MSKAKYDSTTSQSVNPYHPFELEWGSWSYHDSVIKQIKEIFENHTENRLVFLHGPPGSGKTSLLKRIENSPDILGKNYIPIYLDSGKYVGIHLDKLSTLYRDIIKKLNRHGYNIPFSDATEPTKDENTIEFILLTIDSYLKPSDILIVILDEFDNLLKNTDIKGISDFIQYAKDIEKNWSNYGLILVGDEFMGDSKGFSIIDKFLYSGFKIKVNMFLEKEKIENLIVEPAKNILTYDEGAIKKIMWYSGKNLYFQQLICYFIVSHLEDENRKRCTPEDVYMVVNRILAEHKDEFDKAWEKDLSAELKLIASALADESVTERISHMYVLKENNLLDTIFGGSITEKIEELQRFGYIDQIHGRRFTGFPFKIPLYGLFIQMAHPFIRTFVENVEAIADKIDLNILVEEIKKIPADKLDYLDIEAITQIAETWISLKTSLLEKKRTPTTLQIQPFLENFTNLLKLNDPRWDYNQIHFILNINKLNIGILYEMHCLFQSRPDLSQIDITEIEYVATALAQDAPTKLTLLFYFQASDMIEELVKKSYLILIAINENDLKTIMVASRPVEAFRKIILGRLSLQIITPYRTEGPARATFYGRSNILYRISRRTDTSYSIVGARKIGKTSLMYKIKENLPPNIDNIFISLEVEFTGVKSYTPFLKNLENEIERAFHKKVSFSRFPYGKDISKLPGVFRKLSDAQEKRIVLILDEIDVLIEFDRKHKFKLMRIFRTMAQKNYCQFIFAGFKELYHTKRHIENPMYNFCEEIIMEPLENEAALDLITKPMESIGVHYNDQEDRDVILEYTGRHPNLLQFFCAKLIEKVEKHPKIEDRRAIFRTDIEEVFDKEYKKYILDDIYMFFSDLSNINRLILILLVESSLNIKKSYFSLSEIKGLLMDCYIDISLQDVYRNLIELVVRFILIDEKENYRFALPIFPIILKKRVDNDLKKRTITEIKKELKSNA